MSPNRRLTRTGRLVVAGAAIGLALMASCVLLPTRYGFGG